MAEVLEDVNSTVPDVFQRHRKLLQWFAHHDGHIDPHVNIAYSDAKGFHMVVANNQTIKAKDHIVNSPVSLTISILNPLDITPFDCHGTKFPPAFLKNNIHKPVLIQTFFLMEQYALGNDSFWAAYVQSLPSPNDMRKNGFETEEDMVWLEGTNLKSAFIARSSSWRELYGEGIRQLQDLRWPSALNGKYSWELFSWAAKIFDSRSFTSRVLHETLLAQQARSEYQRVDNSDGELKKLFSEQFAVLIPVFDCANHQAMAKVEWRAQTSSVGFCVGEKHTGGQELCNNYGARDNEALLLSYGYAVDGNPFDHMVIEVKQPPGSPVAQVRHWKRRKESTSTPDTYIFNHRHPRTQSAKFLELSVFSFDLLDCIAVLCGNDRELQTVFQNEQTPLSQVHDADEELEDRRNILGAISQLLRECIAKAQKLNVTTPVDKNQSIMPQRQEKKHEFARIYRDSQRSILEAAVAVCTYILLRTCTTMKRSELLHIIEHNCQVTAYSVLEKLTLRCGYLTKSNELLSVENILALLPPESALQVHEAISFIVPLVSRSRFENLEADGHYVDIRLYTAIVLQSQLTILLSCLYIQNLQSIKVPLRLQTWMNQLLQWYPVDDNGWAQVPQAKDEAEPGLWTLLNARNDVGQPDGVLPVSLTPQLLCWAWRVVAEESIMIPESVIAMLSSEQKPNTYAGLRIYCSQD